MTRPSATTRLLLIEDRRAGAQAPVVPLRRYRLARLRFEGISTAPSARFDHLKHAHD